MPRVRSKRWIFVVNNYTEEDEFVLRVLVTNTCVTYVYCGKEIGESGTPHLQGYLETSERCGLRKMKTLIPRAHWEKANGSLASNQAYCSKEDPEPFEDGTPMQQGKRSDLEEIKVDLDNGMSMAEIADRHFSKWVIYRKSFQEYQSMKQRQRYWKTFVSVIWGPTGTGKTRYAHDQIMDRSWWSPGDFQWFDGYNGQEIVILDDYRGEYPVQLFLKLFDRYPMQVPVKGGFTNWRPKKVYITSNVDPKLWYECDGNTHDAFLRRIDRVDHVRDPLYDDIRLSIRDFIE